MKFRSTLLTAAFLIVAGSSVAATLPNYDALAEAPAVSLSSAKRTVAALTEVPATRVQWNDRFGVPSFVWAGTRLTGAVAAARLGQSDVMAAREYVSSYAPLYALDSADIANAHVSGVHDTGRGAIVVKLKQKIGDVEVFREELNVVMDRDRELVALSGHISAVPRTGRIVASSVQATPFLLAPANAVTAAFEDATLGERSININDLLLVGAGEGGYQLYRGVGEAPTRVKRVYFHFPDRYEPAYYLEVTVEGDAQSSNDMYGYVVSAVDGRVLFRNNLTAEQTAPASYTYRVWAGAEDKLPLPGPQGYDGTPHPTGSVDGYQPRFIAPSLVAVPHGPIGTRDPWLSPTATETVGNNVDAYVDLYSPDGFNGSDFRATTTGPFTFDRTYDVGKTAASSPDQRMASTTQLFYDINFLHDWFYDAGFNEAAGNAQTDNYGRGGLGGDSIRGEAQDYSGRNNANMQTPADGGRPRMQMYLWDTGANRTLTVTAPSALAKAYATGTAQFGPQQFEITGDVVRPNPVDACNPIQSPNVNGKIVFVDRGGHEGCTFVLKALNAKAAGAIGVIIGNVETSANANGLVTMACTASNLCNTAEAGYPGTLQLALADANAFRAQLSNGIRVSMRRDGSVERDGTIDNQIVAHEWMHYMSNRLIGNGSGLTSVQARGMGEGWSDFASLLLSVRPDDTRFESNSTFGGAYSTSVYVATGGTNGPQLNNGAYWGIRRAPYSTDLAKNPLTLKHVTAGVRVTGAPIQFGETGSGNAEVHASGEVWANMLWEAYAALLRDTLGNSPRLTFADAQLRMREYLVASLRMTPVDPTFLEARDALLAAAFARDKMDYQRFWEAFAKRGAGISAVAPDRYSASNNTAIEDFNAGGALKLISVVFDDSITSCLRNGVLESSETGAMLMTFRNIGATRLQSTTVSVTSSDTALSFPNGPASAVPASDPGATVIAAVIASLATSTSVIKPDLAITVTDPQITSAGMLRSTYLARLNTADGPKQSSTDDVEGSTTAWTVAGTGAARWTRIAASPRDHRWFAAEPDAAVDTLLVSPTMMVAARGDFTLTFRHRFAFDYFQTNGGLGFVDGGVIELSTDDGQTWIDIGNRIDPSTLGYGSGAILMQNGSAIEGRRSFQAVSPGYNPEFPSNAPFSTTKVNLGGDYAGRRVKVRFRSVTAADHSFTPRLGWEVDDIAFENIMNLPFPALTADRGLCSVSASTTTLASSTATADGGVPVTFTATVGAAMPAAGTVDFFDNGGIIGTAPVQNGTARFTTAALNPGSHVVTAIFNGGKNFAASTSAAVTVQVSHPAGRRRTVGK